MSNYWNKNIPTNNISGFTIYGSQPNVLTSHWRNNNWPPSGTDFVPAGIQNINNGLQVKMRKKCFDSVSDYVVENIDMNNVPMIKRDDRTYSVYASVTK